MGARGPRDIETRKKISNSMKKHFANLSEADRLKTNQRKSHTRHIKESVWDYFNRKKPYFYRIWEWEKLRQDDR